MIRLRSLGGSLRQRPSSKDSRAAWTARSTSSALPAGMCAITRPSHGELLGKVTSDVDSTNFPPMNGRVSGSSFSAAASQSA